MKSPLTFPKNFVWGVATAAPQIEGAAFEDGKGESIWDRFSRVPGKVHNGDTLDMACDHYHLFKEDFALMRRLGIRHYRLSVAWPRIFLQGDGVLNQKGLDFYDRLINAMLAEGITPWVTLFHWDLPQALEDRGGWRTRVVPEAFAAYCDAVVGALGDRVKHWITLNEVICFTAMGYSQGGNKAPGASETRAVVNQTFHHALLCHGAAVRAVREHGGPGAVVGLTDNSSVSVPVTETEADIAAARTLYVEKNAHLLEPMFTGRYSDAYLQRCGADRPKVEKGDFDLISLPTDFLGMNVYSASFVRADAQGKPETLAFPAEYPRTASPWHQIIPQAIYWGPRLAHEVYAPKHIYITENGCGYDEEPVINGEVHDTHRRDLVRNYLAEMHRAIEDGVPIAGYFLWSFMDNYEWQDGYARRFGIVHTDFATQKRTPKLSAHWYAEVMRRNQLV